MGERGHCIKKLKYELHKFLLELPDALLVPGYCLIPVREQYANSIVYWYNWLKCVWTYER